MAMLKQALTWPAVGGCKEAPLLPAQRPCNLDLRSSHAFSLFFLDPGCHLNLILKILFLRYSDNSMVTSCLYPFFYFVMIVFLFLFNKHYPIIRKLCLKDLSYNL